MMKIMMMISAVTLAACSVKHDNDSNAVQAAQQETMLKDAAASLGMPSIRNWREKRTLKMIYELLDQEGLSTYTYVVPSQTGKPVFLCNSVGYAISYATGYTNPEKLVDDQRYGGSGLITMAQAEPNGLFTPDSSDANWVMCIDPKTNKAVPSYVSGPILVSAYELH